MHNKAVEARLCTEPKDNPEEAHEFAVASEEGIKPQASCGECKLEMKLESISVCAISNPEKSFGRCDVPYLHTATYTPMHGSKKM